MDKIKLAAIIVIIIIICVLAFRVSQSDIDACVKVSNYTAAQCKTELAR